MRYPVNNWKTEWNGTAGYGFGAKTSYGYHEGIDINDNLGGNSDLGKPLFAIADGELIYYHTTKHSSSGFGYHHVYKINGPYGTRWVHNAHCVNDLIASVQTVKEGQQIAKVGNSGTQYAHVHFAIFKVDPITLANGIDTIAKTQQQLNDWWENPIQFIEKWIGGGNMANMYKGYDLSNPESMKVAVDVLVRVQQGEFIDKSKYYADINAVQTKLNTCEARPTGNPEAEKLLNDLKVVLGKVKAF